MPIAIQMTNRSQVSFGRLTMSARLTTADNIGTSGTSGTLKGRSNSGRWYRRKMIPTDTMTNAINVPILTNSPSMRMGVNPAAIDTTIPVTMVVTWGVRNLGCTFLAQGG